MKINFVLFIVCSKRRSNISAATKL